MWGEGCQEKRHKSFLHSFGFKIYHSNFKRRVLKMASISPHHHVGKPKAFDDDKVIKGNEEGEELIFYPKDLNIVWGKDSRCWVLEADDHQKPAELAQVCWLEVTGTAENTNPEKDYQVIFILSLTPDAFGWESSYPVYLMMKRGKDGKFAVEKSNLTSLKNNSERFKMSCRLKKGNQQSRELYFSLYEVWSGKWKGGLHIHSVIIKELLPADGNRFNNL